MTETNVFHLSQPGRFTDPLTEVLRNGARALLVHDFVPAGHLSRFVVALVTEELDLEAIRAFAQPKPLL